MTGRTGQHVFVDESVRGGCCVGAAFVDPEHLAPLGRLAESFRMPGQRRWHFAKESAARRRQFIDAIIDSRLARAWVATGTGDERSVRGRCITELAGATLAGRAGWLIIESREEGRDIEDQSPSCTEPT